MPVVIDRKDEIDFLLILCCCVVSVVKDHVLKIGTNVTNVIDKKNMEEKKIKLCVECGMRPRNEMGGRAMCYEC